MAVAFQERAFEGYMNVAIDNYLRKYPNFLPSYVPSQEDEKKLGYDMNYGDILFIQYKAIYNKNPLYTQRLSTKQCKTLLNLTAQGIDLCSVFYVFPYTHEFIEIRKDYFFHKNRYKHGTALLQNAVFISLKDIGNLNKYNKLNLTKQTIPYKYDCSARTAKIDKNPITIYNFYTWAHWAGYKKYNRIDKNSNSFCNICGCPPPSNPNTPNNGGDSPSKYKKPLNTLNKIIQEGSKAERFKAAKNSIANKYSKIDGYEKLYLGEGDDKIRQVQNFVDACDDFLLKYFGIKIYVSLNLL